MCALHYRPGVEVVPGYELLALLGRGGFGEVWKAKGPGGVTLAIKIIDKVDDKAGRKEFRALRLIKDINHPNLVTVSGFWLKDSDGRLIDPEAITDDPATRQVRPAELIIAMDLGEMTLLDYLERCRKGLLETQKGGIPADELLEYMEASAKAIDYLNTRHDVQHRDIKPQNILIVGGSAKICDLGLASTVSAVRTSMGGAGSLAYMAPEVYASKRPSRATDQYSLAIAYAELRTGRLPLSDCESFSVLDDAKRRGILELSWLEEPERTVIAKATSLNPDERYPRCLDMVRALRRACEAGTQTVRPAETLQVLGDYILERRLHHRTGEEIFDATGPEGHRVLLVSRIPADSPDLADGKTLSLMRERSRHHPRLAELFEIVRLSETNRAVPPRLFEGPHPPAFARLLLVSRHVPRNLGENLSGGGVSPGKLMGYMEQMAEVVDFLNAPQHEVGERRVRLMHGNLRPVNFLIDNDRIFLTNFSAVHVLDGDETPFPAGQDVPEGPYTPPEYTAGKLTRWSDQYTLAVAYLQLRTGRPASGLTGSTRSERTPGDARRLDLSDLNPTEKEVLRRATALEPSQRYANCTEMVQALYGAWNVMVARDTPRDSRSDPTRAAPLSSGSVGEADTLATPLAKFDSTGPTIDLDVAAQRPGTLAALAQETRLSTDTDREDVAAAAVSRHAEKRTDARDWHGVPAPKSQGFGGLTMRRSPVRAVALGVAAAALLAGIAWFIFGPPTPERNGDPPALNFSDEAEAEWHKQHVAPLLEEHKFVPALKTIDSAPGQFAKSKLAWRQHVRESWQHHARVLVGSGNRVASLPVLDELLRHFDVSEVEKWRATVLDGLCETGEQLLRESVPSNTSKQPTEALAQFQLVLGSIDDLRPASGRSPQTDAPTARKAALGVARAQARRANWAAVPPQLARAGPADSLSADNALHYKALDFVARHKTGVVIDQSEAERIETSLRPDLAGLDKVESGLLAEAIAEIRTGQNEKLKKLLSGRLTIVDSLVKGKKHAEAWSGLEAIANDDAVKALVSSPGGGAPAFEFCRLRLATIRELPTAASSDTERELSRVGGFFVNRPAPPAGWLVDVVASAKAIALREKQGTKDLLNPKVTDQVLRMLVKAEPLAGDANARQTVTEAIRQIRAASGNAQLAALLKLRDSAATQSDFQSLRDVVRQAAAEGAAHPLLPVMLAESLLMLEDDAASVSAEVEKIAPETFDPQEAAYVSHVQGLIRAGSDVTAAAKSFMAAWRRDPAKGATAMFPWPWQQSAARANQALAALLKAGESNQDLRGDDVKLERNRFSLEKARDAYGWYTLAGNLWVASRGPKPSPQDEEQVLQLRINRALTAAYSSQPNALDLLDKLVDLPPKQLSAHVLLASIGLHRKRYDQDAKNNESRDRIIRNYGRLLEWTRDKPAVEVETTFDQVVAPGFAFLTSSAAAPAELSPAARRAAGQICGERGRMARLFPAIEQKFSSAEAAPMQVSLESYDKAVTYDDRVADYFAGRGIAAYVVGDINEEDRSPLIRENAQRVRHLAGDDPRLGSLAEGLLGLAILSESYAILEFDAKSKKLEESARHLQAAAENFKPLPDEYLHSDEFQRFLTARGGVYLKLANYVPVGQKKEWLEKAVALAESIVKNYEHRARPEEAFALWGNSLEDFGLFGVDRPGYVRSWDKFRQQYAMAPADDKRARARARINLGRSMYRYHATNLGDAQRAQREAKLGQQLAAARSTPLAADTPDVAQTKKEALRRAGTDLGEATRKLGEAEAAARSELVKASVFLEDAIKEARNWKSIQADAHNWIGRLHALSPIDDFDKADKHFEQAVGLIDERHRHWPELSLDRARNSIEFARRHLASGRVNVTKARPLILQAIAQAEPLAASTAPTVHDRHRISARGIILQGRLWIGDSAGADRAYAAMPVGLESIDDRAAAQIEAARRILSLPRDPDSARLMTDKERELADRSFAELSALANRMSFERKWDFYRVNRDHFFYWQDRATLVRSQYLLDPSSSEIQAVSVTVLEQIVKHLGHFAQLAKDTEWVQLSKQRNDADWRAYGADLPKWPGHSQRYQGELSRLRAKRR
jgi:serine/threonine protein kinase